MVKKTKKILQNFIGDKAKSLFGEVVSNKMNKTAVVKVTRTFKHSLYGKIVKRSKKYKIHDEDNVCNIGDFVEMGQTRLLSKTKHMVLKRVITKQDRGV